MHGVSYDVINIILYMLQFSFFWDIPYATFINSYIHYIISCNIKENINASLHEAEIVKVSIKVVQDNDVIAEVRCNILSLIEILWKVDLHQSALKLNDSAEVIRCLCEHDNELINCKAKSVAINCHFNM